MYENLSRCVGENIEALEILRLICFSKQERRLRPLAIDATRVCAAKEEAQKPRIEIRAINSVHPIANQLPTFSLFSFLSPSRFPPLSRPFCAWKRPKNFQRNLHGSRLKKWRPEDEISTKRSSLGKVGTRNALRKSSRAARLKLLNHLFIRR